MAHTITQANSLSYSPIWDHGVKGQNEVISISDTGVDFDNCFFWDDAVPVPVNQVNFQHRKIIFYSTVDPTDPSKIYEPGDSNGHGTHTAGSLAGRAHGTSHASGADIKSLSNYNGMAPEAKLAVFDYMSANAGDFYTPDDLYKDYFTKARDVTARLSSNSWGDTGAAYDTYCIDTDRFTWDNPDFLVSYAAGNYGSGPSSLATPAVSKNAITFGSCYNSVPNDDSLSSFSSRGPTLDNRIKPDVITPGSSIQSSRSDRDLNTYECSVPESTTVMSGTSMATPVGTGTAALVRSYYSQGFYSPPPYGGRNSSKLAGQPLNPSAALVKATMIQSAVAMLGEDNVNGIVMIPSFNQVCLRFG